MGYLDIAKGGWLPPVTLLQLSEQHGAMEVTPNSVEGSQTPSSDLPTKDNVPNTDRFTKFGRLPTELRLKIWKAALPGGRVVQYPVGEKRVIRAKRTCGTINSCITTTFANRESLDVARKTYKQLFVDFPSRQFGSQAAGGQPFVYVNYNIDAVLIEPVWLTPSELPRAFRSVNEVKHLSIGYPGPPAPSNIWGLLKQTCPKLQRLTFVETSCPEHGNKWTYEWTLVDFPPHPNKWTVLPDNYNSLLMRESESNSKGALAVLSAEAEKLRNQFAEFVDNLEWSNVSFNVACEEGAPDSCASANECLIYDDSTPQFEGGAADSGTSANECLINHGSPPQFEEEVCGSDTSSNKCPIDDDCPIEEDWSTYIHLLPDLSSSAQSTPSPPASPSLLCSTEAAAPGAYRILPTQICTHDSSTQSTSYIPNADINGLPQESYLDLLYLSSPIEPIFEF
ncbi:hypothetical protein F5882DRAFT_387535 [Hyaloscypha sp. PMI_1271]|nr:hypothetical protein F5882DRAFT_387535 [Hyaloscypha sp. PMI_1271]